MAGDWIPITTDLVRRREVALIAQQLKRSPQEVVGFLLEFWGWASGETEDGIIRSYSVATASATLGHPPAFYDMLLSESIGWLRKENGSLVIANWDRWLSNSAKARLGKSLGQKIRRAKFAATPAEVGAAVATNVATKLLPQDRTGQRRLKTSLRPSGDVEKDGGGDGGALETAPAPQTGRTEIDWAEVKKTANRFARLGLNEKPQDVSLVMKLAAMNEQGRIPVDWSESFIEAMHKNKPTKPGAYLMGMFKKHCKAAGLDFRLLLAETPVPAEFLTKAKP